MIIGEKKGKDKRKNKEKGERQAPEKFLAALAVLGAAWQYRSHFNLKVTSFQEQQSCSRSQECALGSSCLSQGGVQKQKHVFLSTFCG